MRVTFSDTPMTKLPREFFRKSAHLLAPELLGKFFIRKINSRYIGGVITEVEAYEQHDPASHSFRGITPRNKLMFGDAGFLYVYLIYGIHCCANIVSGTEGSGEAVLLRSITPAEGIQYIQRRRGNLPPEKLLNGPGNICKGLNISRQDNGTDLCGKDIFIAEIKRKSVIPFTASPRIGISKAKEVPWRFRITEEKAV